MYDIAIVGAGPSGATLARLVPRGMRVLLVDARRLDLPAEQGAGRKVCGGLLAPKAQRELARQGLGVPGKAVLGPQLFAVRTVDSDTHLERLYQRFYVNTDREEFDRWLVGLVPSGVDRRFGWSFTRLEPDDGGGSTLRFRTASGTSVTARAKLVVGADGARSAVRRAAFPGAPLPDRYAAVQAVFDSAGGEPHYGAIFDPRLTDFYGWTIPKGDVTLVGAAFPAGRATPAAFDEFVAATRAAGFRFGSEIRREAAMILRPTSPRQLHPGAAGVALLGEAAGFISPSSAEGISYALRSARILARALEPGLAGAVPRYRAATLPVAADVCARMLKSDAIYGTATRRLIMRTGLGAIGVSDEAGADLRVRGLGAISPRR